MSMLFHGEPGTHCLGIQKHFLERAHMGTHTYTHTFSIMKLQGPHNVWQWWMGGMVQQTEHQTGKTGILSQNLLSCFQTKQASKGTLVCASAPGGTSQCWGQT